MFSIIIGIITNKCFTFFINYINPAYTNLNEKNYNKKSIAWPDSKQGQSRYEIKPYSLSRNKTIKIYTNTGLTKGGEMHEASKTY